MKQFIKFPADKTGPNRKLSNPWHGPYRVVARKDPDLTATKVYFPQEEPIQVHQQRVTSSPPALVAVYYWYGPKKHSSGKVTQWVGKLMKEGENNTTQAQVVHPDGPGYEEAELLQQLEPWRIRS